jgi:hypothetical protein
VGGLKRNGVKVGSTSPTAAAARGKEGPAPPKQRRPRYTRPSVIDSAAQREAAGVVRAREIHIAGDKAP